MSRAEKIRAKAEAKLARGEELTMADFSASHSNGLAMSEKDKSTIQKWWLNPNNTRVSPNQSDHIFVRDPETGKQDKEVQIQWREETFFDMYRKFKTEVRIAKRRVAPVPHLPSPLRIRTNNTSVVTQETQLQDSEHTPSLRAYR